MKDWVTEAGGGNTITECAHPHIHNELILRLILLSPIYILSVCGLSPPSPTTSVSSLLISCVGYSGDFDPDVMKLVGQPPLPQVVITNYGLAHRAYENHSDTLRRFRETEYNYWSVEHPKVSSMPPYRFYVDSRGVIGKRAEKFQGNKVRRNSAMIRDVFSKELGFSVIHEYTLMAGRFDNQSDGWHFFGTGRLMESVIVFNMICNDWMIRKEGKDRSHEAML